nr:hypothetical protein [uncultured bacterium]
MNFSENLTKGSFSIHSNRRARFIIFFKRSKCFITPLFFRGWERFMDFPLRRNCSKSMMNL